jgi:hypothetical protein
MAKKEVNLEHLEWAIQSRAKNQKSCLKLLVLLENHADFWNAKKASKAAQDLIAVAFSLWRAAFLAEKSGKRSEVFAHGRDLLEKVIEDNAISYLQDKNSREWTFNYYTKNARSSLTLLSKYWEEVPSYKGMARSPKERWDYCQELLDTSISNFEDKLKSRAAAKERRENARKTREGAKQRRAKVREITLSQRSSTRADMA